MCSVVAGLKQTISTKGILRRPTTGLVGLIVSAITTVGAVAWYSVVTDYPIVQGQELLIHLGDRDVRASADRAWPLICR